MDPARHGGRGVMTIEHYNNGSNFRGRQPLSTSPLPLNDFDSRGDYHSGEHKKSVTFDTPDK